MIIHSHRNISNVLYHIPTDNPPPSLKPSRKQNVNKKQIVGKIQNKIVEYIRMEDKADK